MPTVREYEAALQRDPANAEVFAALRKAYRQVSQHDKLVVLYETRAQAVTDGAKAAELFYLAAELRLDQLGDAAGAEADLANAVDRDPGHIRAATRLKDIYREAGRTPDYMVMLEMEAAAVARTHDPARVAELESEMGQLFANHFARLERNVRNNQRPAKLSAENIKSIESARKIYRALGDYRGVVRLYELELEGTTDAKRRADLLLGIGRVLGEKLEELDAAAQRLNEVIRLRPRDEKALELLASIYANPNWVGADGAERSAALYLQVGRRRYETGDVENAVSALRKALAAFPGHTESSELLERVYQEQRRFQELDRYYRERVAAAGNDAEKIEFLYKRAELSERDLPDPAEAQRIFAELNALEPPSGRSWERMAELLAEGRDYAKLADLRERQLAALQDPALRIPVMTELATLYRDRLGDREQAAIYLHGVLQLEPEHPQAQKAYAEHFREKGDWPALVELLEFSIELAIARNASPEELARPLEEIATIAEKNLNDSTQALDAWRRIEQLAPSYGRARESQRRLLLKEKNWEGMAALLEREAGLQSDPSQRSEILRRAAQIHREKLSNATRAIEIYKDILRAEPHDAVALRALVEIHEREEDFAGLAKTLREQIDRTPAKQERVSLLRRLLAIDDERLGNLAEGGWAASEILQIVPGDRDTLTRLEGILERGGDYARLVEVLEQHASIASNTDETVPLVRQMAELYQTRLNDGVHAAERWEEVARLDPGDSGALEALTAIYTEAEKLPELARILDLQVERLAADPGQQAEPVRRLALLAEGPLQDRPRALRYWETLSELLPSDSEALEALSRIYADEGEWGTLIRILERRVALAKDPGRAAELAMQRAEVLDGKLNNPSEAATALEQVITELDPRNVLAHDRLRALYESSGDWERVIKVAERHLFLIEDPAARAPRALEIGVLWRDRLHDDRKATAAFERVLEIDPQDVDAIAALAPLYGKSGDWQRLIFTDEKLLDRCEDPRERRRLMLEIARLSDQELAEPRRSFEWLKRAYAESPDDETLRLVDQAAARHSLNEELIQIYEGARARAADPAAQLAAAQKIAAICEDKLADPRRAFTVLREALPADPAGRELLPVMERLAEQTGNWSGLLDIYATVARARQETSERVELLRLRAGVRERHLNDPGGALDETMRSFAMAPQNPSIQDEVLRLARVTGRWEDALTVQGHLFTLGEDLHAKLTVARNAAQLVEVEVKDLVRAFRAYLNAFRLAPDDQEITGHLWRLAAEIGRYEGPAAPVAATVVAPIKIALDPGPATVVDLVIPLTPEPAPAIETAAADAPQEAVPEDDASGADTEAVAAPTELSAETGQASADAALATDAGDPDRHDVSHDVDMGDLDASDEDSALELSDEELLDDVTDDGAAASDVLDTGDASVMPRTRTPPPPPMAAPPPPPPVPARRPAVAPRPAFETPWEELAQAYESLPQTDAHQRLARLLKIAEIWERGQHDLPRAMNALERAFRLDPTDLTTRRELDRLAKTHDLWDRVAEIYLGAIEQQGDVERAVALHHDVARMRQALEQIDKAEQLYDAILHLKSDDKEALDRLEIIYRDQHRWEELSNLLERRTGGALDATLTPIEKRARFRELAELHEIRLEKPYEAIDSLERFVASLRREAQTGAGGEGDNAGSEGSDGDGAVTPGEALREQSLEGYEGLARLYSRVGLWAKVVDNIQHQAELTTDPVKARALRLRLAAIYETELAAPDRAMEAYQSILARQPDDREALTALDRLLESHGRFDALQDVLAQRAQLATGEERLKIVRRRAKLLEDRLGNPEAAAASLRDLGPEAIADTELMTMLVRNLRRAGLAHEAARILSQKIEAEKKRRGRAARARVATLSLELSLIRLDDLNDPEGARQAVEAALVASPDHAAALAALAALHLKANDFAAYAETRLRQARAFPADDKPAIVEALLDAGRVYREQVLSADKARACFEEALQHDPQSRDALRALASVLSSQGAWEEAKQALVRQLELTEAPEARADILTDLGRACWEGSGDAQGAIVYLEEALTLRPDLVAAVAMIADVYYKEGQWENAEKRLAEAVRRLRGQPSQMALLYLRLAEVHERLGKLEDAYRQLQEADRAASGQLLTKVALGENRFRAGKWREAAQHLSALADHPDAASYPDEVTAGLAHGAQAEIKQRRPERAIALYEAALRVRPTHATALRALADLALERGQAHQSASYLRRLADATADPAERATLLEQLGDRLADVKERAPALTAYQQVLELGGAATTAQIPLLEKMLKLQRAASDLAGAAQTAARLLALVQDPKERTVRRREAALLMSQQGDAVGAAMLAGQTLEEDPGDERALAMLCEVWAQLGKNAELEQRLAATLPDLPIPASDDADARRLRADLWERLGALRTASGSDGALTAYQHVIELDPTRVPPREALARLYGDRSEYADAAAENQRVLLATNIARPDGLRTLAGYYARRGLLDRARCCYELLDVLGAATADEQAFLAKHPVPALKPDDPYPGTIDEVERAAHLTLPQIGDMGEVFSCLWEGAAALTIGPTVEEMGMSSQDKISPMSDLDLGKIYGQVSKALVNKRTALYFRADGAGPDMTIVVQAPPALVIGPDLALSGRYAEMRFQLARGIELTRPAYILAAGLQPRPFAQLFAAVLKAFHPRHARRHHASAGDSASEQVAKLKRSVPYKVAKRLVELFGAQGRAAWSSVRWRALVQQTGNRAGLLLCGDLKVAVRLVLAQRGGPAAAGEISGEDLIRLTVEHEPLRGLLQYAISEDYFHLREKLGTAVAGAVAA